MPSLRAAERTRLLLAASIRKIRTFLADAIEEPSGAIYVPRKQRMRAHARTGLPPGCRTTRHRRSLTRPHHQRHSTRRWAGTAPKASDSPGPASISPPGRLIRPRTAAKPPSEPQAIKPTSPKDGFAVTFVATSGNFRR
jgi:hypothetical protein